VSTWNFRKLHGRLVSEEPRDEDALSTWPRRRYLEMDARFRNALITAIEAGLEKMPEAERGPQRSVPCSRFSTNEAGRFATPTAPRPASARDSPWGQDTSVRLSFS
jgi:hypothetical protein